MRPDSVDVSSEPVKTDPVHRVKPTRRKEREEREERDKEFEDAAKESARRRDQVPATRDAEKKDSSSSSEDATASGPGKSLTKGKRLDLTI